MSAKCYYYDVNELIDPQLFARAMELLPWEERREKVNRFRFDKDKRLCLGAGILVSCVLKQKGILNPEIIRTDLGKPELVNHPEVHFNISHSGSLAVCAVSEKPVGADVEIIKNAEWRVARRCFTEDELIWLEKAPDADYAFTQLWTRKESYLKLLGTGLSREMNSFSVFSSDSLEEEAVFTEREAAGHVINVCTSGPSPVEFIQVHNKFIFHLMHQ
jgi:4'-phosphopantetheinyl transferase